jgi:hypothetical protein
VTKPKAAKPKPKAPPAEVAKVQVLSASKDIAPPADVANVLGFIGDMCSRVRDGDITPATMNAAMGGVKNAIEYMKLLTRHGALSLVPPAKTEQLP